MAENLKSANSNLTTPENAGPCCDSSDPRVRSFNLQLSQFIFLFFFLLIAWFLGYWGFSSIWVILLLLLLFTGDCYTRQLSLRRKLDALLLKDELRAVEEVVETLPSWVRNSSFITMNTCFFF